MIIFESPRENGQFVLFKNEFIYFMNLFVDPKNPPEHSL